MNAPYELSNAMARAICGMPPSFTASPTADAEEHFDNAADTFLADVEYLGLKLTAEVDRSGHLVDVLQADGTCLMDELSERALRKILALACEGETA